ncbi:MAG TPA: hypothetical protein VFE58_01545 [Tepidisphaeraceae bacterium]|jgi:hypothetical protein|nr:hypothetical protein [Tepidisphaeraceae bacterium]
MSAQETIQYQIAQQSLVVASLLWNAVSVWILTVREPKTPRVSWRRAGLWAARVCALGPALALLEQLYSAYHSQNGIVMLLQRREYYLLPTLLCLYIPVPALLFLHLRRLAVRIGRPRLAEHAGIVGVGLSICFLAIPTHAMLPKTNKMIDSLIVLPAACICLFIAWGMFLLARMAAAFYRAIGEARQAWKKADAAAA